MKKFDFLNVFNLPGFIDIFKPPTYQAEQRRLSAGRYEIKRIADSERYTVAFADRELYFESKERMIKWLYKMESK